MVQLHRDAFTLHQTITYIYKHTCCDNWHGFPISTQSYFPNIYCTTVGKTFSAVYHWRDFCKMTYMISSCNINIKFFQGTHLATEGLTLPNVWVTHIDINFCARYTELLIGVKKTYVSLSLSLIIYTGTQNRKIMGNPEQLYNADENCIT